MLIDKELPVSCSHVTETIFFFNSMVTVHIKPTAPYHTTVLTASVKKIQLPPSFTHIISVRLSKNLAKDGTLAKSEPFTLYLYLNENVKNWLISNTYAIILKNFGVHFPIVFLIKTMNFKFQFLVDFVNLGNISEICLKISSKDNHCAIQVTDEATKTSLFSFKLRQLGYSTCSKTRNVCPQFCKKKLIMCDTF